MANSNRNGIEQLMSTVGQLEGRLGALDENLREFKVDTKASFTTLNESLRSMSVVPMSLYEKDKVAQKAVNDNHNERIKKLEDKHEIEDASIATGIKNYLQENLISFLGWAFMVGALLWVGYLVANVYRDTSAFYIETKGSRNEN